MVYTWFTYELYGLDMVYIGIIWYIYVVYKWFTYELYGLYMVYM